MDNNHHHEEDHRVNVTVGIIFIIALLTIWMIGLFN